MSTAAPLSEETTPALSQGQRLLCTFTAPSRTMADIRRNTSWWVPWLLISVFSLGISYVMEKKIGFEQIVETQIQQNPKTAEQFDKMPSDQRDKMMKLRVSITRVIVYATPVVMLIVIVVVAAVLLGVFNFGFGARLRFGELLSVTAYSYLPSILNSLLMCVVMFSVAPDAFDVKNPVATNPGYFIPSSSPFLKGALSAFDVFTFWQIFLMSVGVEQLSKVKKWTAFATLFLLFFLMKLARAGLSAR